MRQLLYYFLYIVAVVLYIAILISRNEPVIKPIALYVQFKPQIALPVVAVFLISLLSLKDASLRKGLTLTLILTLFALSLNGVWANTRTGNYLVSGMLPFSDANFQYAGILRVLDYGEFNGTASRRPFFGELAALLMHMSQRNLQATIAVIVFFAAVSTWYALVEVSNNFSKFSAVLFLSTIYLFYSRFIGTMMTENLGLILGLFSFFFLLRGIRLLNLDEKRSIVSVITGTFLFSLAQNARPAAVMTIPLLVLLAGLLFRRGRFINWKMILILSLVSLTPFLINQIHFSVLGLEESQPMSNSLYGLHGFVSGGYGWAYVFDVYPGFSGLSSAEQNQYFLSSILYEVFNNPGNIIQGYLQEFRWLFSMEGQTGLLSYLQIAPRYLDSIFRYSFLAFFVVGIVGIFANIKKPLWQLAGITIAGYLISIPFAPSYQTIYMRVYAASLPFFFLIPMLGLEFLLGKLLPVDWVSPAEKDPANPDVIPVFFFAGLIVFLPLLLIFFPGSAPKTNPTCPQDMTASTVFYNPSSAIHVVEDENALVKNWAPYTFQYKFHQEIHNICCRDDIAFYKGLTAPFSMFVGVEENKGVDIYYVIADPEDLPEEPGWLQICGKVTDIYGNPSSSGFLIPTRIREIN